MEDVDDEGFCVVLDDEGRSSSSSIDGSCSDFGGAVVLGRRTGKVQAGRAAENLPFSLAMKALVAGPSSQPLPSPYIKLLFLGPCT